LLLTLALGFKVAVHAGSAPIPLSEIGAKATADYQGEALSIAATPEGARLRCGFQQLEGHATGKGLWLKSTVAGGGKFRLTAAAIGRQVLEGTGPVPQVAGAAAQESGRGLPQSKTLSRGSWLESVSGERSFATTGAVAVAQKVVRFIRPGVTEEYTVSVDGLQQDFVLTERPAGEGYLWVGLALTGARAEATAYGAKLVLEGSGRKLAYSQLRATDAAGKELRARMEVLTGSAERTTQIANAGQGVMPSASRGSKDAAPALVVVVDDAEAVYPVRIDPTFSDADWVSLNPGMPGVNGDVRAVAVDGSGNVFVGGSFTVIGTVAANHIAKWNGSRWSALGSGMNWGYVLALAVSGTNLYAGGMFTAAGGVAANYIAKWNGSVWSALGSGMGGGPNPPYVHALAVSGTNLYAGGKFTTAGEVAVHYIAKWNGSAWSSLGSGMDSWVYALAVSGTTLYAGGWFTTADGVPANYIAKWNGSGWSPLGSGMGFWVNALAVSGTTLYAGGEFGTAGGVPANYIARWNGSAWSALGAGLNSGVTALAASGTTVYAAGYFNRAGAVTANQIAKWNGSTWSAMGAGMSGGNGNGTFLNALAVSGSTVYAGGEFTRAGTVTANGIAKWNVSTWSALGPVMGGPNALVYALEMSGTNLYVGGNFTMAGGVTANFVAKWNGRTWSALGSGVDGTVSALALNGTNLYAGGYFTMAGGAPASYIAKWDGNAWSALGEGVSGGLGQTWVNVLAVSGTNLYVGGEFYTAGGLPAANIAQWDGSAWSALGSGMDNDVSALAVSGTNLYAGGLFTMAGGAPAKYIAKWDGTTWSALSSGMSLYGSVAALALSGSDLYAGGWFTTAGGTPANYIAKWNGSTWSTLGTGMNGFVEALAVSGTTLYAGGRFTTAGGVAANYVAAWNGSVWTALGSGVDFWVRALLADGTGHLLVGGEYYLAGNKVSPFIAQANVGAGLSAGRLGSLAYAPVTGFGCTFSDAVIGQPYYIQSSPSAAGGGWTNLTNFTYMGPTVIRDPSAAAGQRKFYRAVSP
jgi:hypothetical protein